MPALALITMLLLRLAVVAGPGMAELVGSECQGFPAEAVITELQNDITAYQQGYTFSSWGGWGPEYPDFFSEKGCI